MRKLLLALVVTLLLPLYAQAIDVTIAGASFSGYNYSGSSARLRIYPSQTFTASDSTTVPGGTQPGATTGFFTTVNCTVASNTLTCPSVTLKSTTDALTGSDTEYSVVLFDAAGTRRDFFPLSSFWLSHTNGASTTWAVIAQYNSAGTRPPVAGSYTTQQTDSIIAALATAPPSATYITQTPNATLTGEQALSTLSTGIVTVTTGTGVLSSLATGTQGRPLVAGSAGPTYAPNYYNFSPADTSQQTWVQQNNAYPSFGASAYPADAALLYQGTATAHGNLFGFVSEVGTGSALKASLRAGHVGGYVAAVHGTCRSTLGATTTFDCYGGNFVAEVNPGWSNALAIAGELSVNENRANASVDFQTAQQASAIANGYLTGMTIGSGGKYHTSTGLEFFGAHAGALFRRAIVVPHESFTHRAFEAGTVTAPIPATLPGLVAVKHIPTGNAFLVQRSNVGDTGKAFALYTEAATPVHMASLDISGYWDAAWYKANQSDGVQVWVDDTPTKAIAFSTAVPGAAHGQDIHLSTYSSTGTTGWRERLAILNQTNLMRVGGAFTIQWGTGAPEGAVTASVGSLWIRTDGGAGTSLCVKESGSGNTGWACK